MPRVKFTPHLKQFFPDLEETQTPAGSVRSILEHLEKKYPRISSYLLDDAGALRRHVVIFIGEEAVKDRTTLGQSVAEGQELFIFQALSGG